MNEQTPQGATEQTPQGVEQPIVNPSAAPVGTQSSCNSAGIPDGVQPYTPAGAPVGAQPYNPAVAPMGAQPATNPAGIPVEMQPVANPVGDPVGMQPPAYDSMLNQGTGYPPNPVVMNQQAPAMPNSQVPPVVQRKPKSILAPLLTDNGGPIYPPVDEKFNWGAFFLNFIHAFCHKQYKLGAVVCIVQFALLIVSLFIPYSYYILYPLGFVVSYLCGRIGYRAACLGKHYASADELRARERKYFWIGLVIVGSFTIFVVVGNIYAMYALHVAREFNASSGSMIP